MLANLKKTFSFIAFSLLITACSSSKKGAYYYSTETYGIDKNGDKQQYSVSNIVSYRDYVFEFKSTKVIEWQPANDSLMPVSVNYKPNGVFLLNGNTRRYYEFDSFALEAKLVQQGPFSEKPFGLKLEKPVKLDSSDTYYGKVKDTVINNIPCFYSDILFKDAKTESDIEQKAILIKKRGIHSLYSINGIEFTDKRYCIIFFSVYLHSSKESFFGEISSLRPLSKKEVQICNTLIEKAAL